MKKLSLLAMAIGLSTTAIGAANAAPKNVILMITDGRSYASMEATSHYRGSAPVYQGRGWTKLSMVTTSLNNNAETNPKQYDPERAWISDGKGGLKPNQEYLNQNATDSAAGISAMTSGQKILNSQLNLTPDGKPLSNIAELFTANDRGAGVLTTVNWTHATPAGAGAHNVSRARYVEIATEMLHTSGLDVIIGAGHPFYDNNGQRTTTPRYNYVGEENWAKLLNGSLDYTLITRRSDFVSVANSPNPPAKLVGMYEANSTAQQGRGKYDPADTPGSVPFNKNVPTMSEMALAALNVLNRNEKGFFVLMEGGAIDWAAHANQLSRMIEEHMDFDSAVDAVSKWVEKNGGWDNNLVIITSDHGNGMPTGPNGETHPVNRGKGNLPGFKWNTGGHTNEIVPLFARGSGAELFKWFVRGKDPVRGDYVDNTDVFRVMQIAAGVR